MISYEKTEKSLGQPSSKESDGETPTTKQKPKYKPFKLSK
jgi:hypothetical protein